jgi:hypothetical protein
VAMGTVGSSEVVVDEKVGVDVESGLKGDGD